MSIDLLSLPRNAIRRMFMLLEDKTRLQMREVCSTTKEMADFSFFNQKTVVNCFNIQDEYPHRIWTCTKLGVQYVAKAVLGFFLSDPRDYLVWRICLSSIFSKLKIPKLAITHRTYYVIANLTMDEAKKCLNLLNPLIQRSQLMELRIWHDDSEIVNLMTEYLNRKCIPTVSLTFCPFESENNDWYPLLKVVQTVKPNELVYIISQITNDSVELVNGLANYVIEICVFLKNNIDDLGIGIISLLQGVLRRKCEKLHISVNKNEAPNTWDLPDQHSTPLIFQADLEKLIQVIHHLGKKVSFTTYTDVDPLSVLVGLYNVEISHYGDGKWLSIDHVD